MIDYILNNKGFDKIENFDEFTGLNVIYLEGNCLSEQGIQEYSGLDSLKELVNLNLIYNREERGLGIIIKTLNSLNQRNRVGINGISDLLTQSDYQHFIIQVYQMCQIIKQVIQKYFKIYSKKCHLQLYFMSKTILEEERYSIIEKHQLTNQIVQQQSMKGILIQGKKVLQMCKQELE